MKFSTLTPLLIALFLVSCALPTISPSTPAQMLTQEATSTFTPAPTLTTTPSPTPTLIPTPSATRVGGGLGKVDLQCEGENGVLGYYIYDLNLKTYSSTTGFSANPRTVKFNNYSAVTREGNLEFHDLDKGTVDLLVTGSKRARTYYYGFSAAFSPDGKFLSYSEEQGIWLYSIESKEKNLFIPKHTSLQWSPDGKEIIFTDLQGTYYISKTDGTEKKRLKIPANQGIVYVTWIPNPNLRQFLFSGADSTWSIFDLDSLKIELIKPHDRGVYADFIPPIWSPDGRWFARPVFTSYTNDSKIMYLCSLDNKSCTILDVNNSENDYFCNEAVWHVSPNQ